MGGRQGFDRADLDRLRDTVPVSHVARTLCGLKFKHAGDEQICSSPFSSDSDPSFKINDRKRLWKDFSTGKGGDVFALLMEVKGLSFLEAATAVSDIAKGVNGTAMPAMPAQAEAPESHRPARQPTFDASSDEYPGWFLGFFQRRGITEDVLREHGVYPAVVWFGQSNREERAVVMPYRYQGELSNNKYRGPNKLFRQDKNARKTIYNIDGIVDNDTAIWVEGEMDVLAMAVAGFPNAISVPDGAPQTTGGVEAAHRRYHPVRECADELGPIQTHIIATDADQAGRAHAQNIVNLMGVERCRMVTFPMNCKDANDVLVKHGAEALRKCIEEARGWPIEGLKELLPGELLEYRNSPSQERFFVDDPQLRKVFSVRPGQLFVVTGWPGDGKSEFMDWLAVELSQRYGWTWAVCSPEHSRLEHASKLAEKYAGEPVKAYGMDFEPMSDETLVDAERWVSKHFVWIESNAEKEDSLTTQFVLDKARAAWIRHKVKGVILDPWNELAHEARRDQTYDHYVGQALRRIKGFARHHDVLFVIIAHPRKLYQKPDSEKRAKPTLHDISGSSNFWNKADIGAVVHREKLENEEVQFIVEKMKRKDQGMPGIVEMVWDKNTGRYRPVRTGAQLSYVD